MSPLTWASHLYLFPVVCLAKPSPRPLIPDPSPGPNRILVKLGHFLQGVLWRRPLPLQLYSKDDWLPLREHGPSSDRPVWGSGFVTFQLGQLVSWTPAVQIPFTCVNSSPPEPQFAFLQNAEITSSPHSWASLTGVRLGQGQRGQARRDAPAPVESHRLCLSNSSSIIRTQKPGLRSTPMRNSGVSKWSETNCFGI